MDYPYVFSVIMAVYNTGCYLCEAIDSVVSQDIGFGYVQLILIDDGSTDESGMICDEYASKWPNNIVVIHQKNAGVAVARNAGLRLAEGQFINFMDSDDKLTSNTFSSVYSFFKENEGETQVVTIPIEFFDGCSGQHWQNEKFNKGDRVIYLLKEYTAPLMFVNASFFKLELKDEIVFDPSLVCGEDIKIMLKVLINKFT
ncbi:MAG TPA: glycosyltransferase family A protein, partial [Enterococcus sp.]|nr:glycosyltransferase family A protein [Enterococcus sp.]